MFHFFPRFAKDVQDSPFAVELRRLAVPHRLFARELNRHYASRIGLLFRVYPMLLFCAGRMAVRSLLLSQPRPRVVVISSDVEALVFGVVRALFARRTQIVFETFIATDRGSVWARRLHHWYYGIALWFVDVAICHSESEARDYARRFPHSRFAALPYALSVNGRAQLCANHAEAADRSNVIVAAGRSGRDYATLAKAVEGLPVQLRVICDWERPTLPLEDLPGVTILRRCFRGDLLAELAQARMVVVPLSQSRASAGQMVLLQAFALRRPVIITDTVTTREYVTDRWDGLLTGFGDPADLRAKIVTLLDDPAQCASLGQRASERYDAEFSTEAYVGKLTGLLQDVANMAEAVKPVVVAQPS